MPQEGFEPPTPSLRMRMGAENSLYARGLGRIRYSRDSSVIARSHGLCAETHQGSEHHVLELGLVLDILRSASRRLIEPAHFSLTT